MKLSCCALAPALLAIAPLVASAPPSSAPDSEIRSAAEAMTPRLVELRRDIHRHPELSNREERTGRLVAERLRALGLEVRHPVAKTGVVGILKGGRPGPVIALRADLDALPIQERNDVPYKSEVPGVKHACGHDAHTTIVLGTAEVLAKLSARLAGTIVFVFQPAEEGAPAGEQGGASLMIQEGLLDSPKIEAMYGLHMDPTLDVGQLGWAIGPIFASSDTFRIEVQGQKTHGAYPHTGLDPVPVAAEIVQALQLVVSRQLDARNPKVLTIGSIHGGNRFNIIAEQVVLEGTIRTLDAALRTDLKQRMARTVRGVAEAHGTQATLRFQDDGNPPTLNDAALTRAALSTFQRVYGADKVLEVAPQMGAEDFAQFAARVPALYVKMGVRNSARGITAMIHTEDFDLDEAVLPLGVRAMASVLWDHLARATSAAPAGR
jgi:amidohydrolase